MKRILKEILETLKSIDRRLERIEEKKSDDNLHLKRDPDFVVSANIPQSQIKFGEKSIEIESPSIKVKQEGK